MKCGDLRRIKPQGNGHLALFREKSEKIFYSVLQCVAVGYTDKNKKYEKILYKSVDKNASLYKIISVLRQ